MKKISLRLPEIMIDELKLLANKRDIPYQSLLKMFLAEKIEHELHSKNNVRLYEERTNSSKEGEDDELPEHLHF